ncbi:hypothetical protein SAMN05216257_1202 [Meinhardsimonia xiamenensis]|jgi:hypothetical protein|uniref:Uncharacterized protein n=1 Tax=Meinhardsimonia xiamenensis TaxID=990712 RepID=A0A1G9HNL4_9RHOB|nr:hypothetical protein LV81_03068 [Meinhardsimonia xiamenensis]SDL14587.1 hypothetical protein SAMN05216257_1202 [Meinhardsimonia xiamenensis]
MVVIVRTSGIVRPRVELGFADVAYSMKRRAYLERREAEA